MTTSKKSKEGFDGKGRSKPIKDENDYIVVEDIQLVLKNGKKIGLLELLSSPELCRNLSDEQLAALSHIYELIRAEHS